MMATAMYDSHVAWHAFDAEGNLVNEGIIPRDHYGQPLLTAMPENIGKGVMTVTFG